MEALKERSNALLNMPLQSDFLVFFTAKTRRSRSKTQRINSFLMKYSLRQELCVLSASAVKNSLFVSPFFWQLGDKSNKGSG